MSTYTPAIVNPCRCCGGEAIGYSYLVSTTDWAHGVKCRYNDCQTVDQQADTAQAAAELWNSAQQQPASCSMKADIKQLVDQIIETARHIEAEGRYQVYLGIWSHIKRINLNIWPVGIQIQEECTRLSAGYDYSLNPIESPEEQHAHALAELNAMLARARQFIDGSADA